VWGVGAYASFVCVCVYAYGVYKGGALDALSREAKNKKNKIYEVICNITLKKTF
jgi:hypothetical protein